MRFSEKITLLGFFSLVLASCAVAPSPVISEPSRSLAQAEPSGNEVMEKSFRDIWSSASPASDFMAQMNRLVELYFRGQKFLMDFDHEQNTLDLVALSGMESYHKLQVIRVLQEQQSELLVYLYGRFVDMEHSGSPENQKRASAVLSAFSRYMLLNRNKLHRLAMQNFVQDLRLARAEHEQNPAVAETEFRSAEEITAFLDAREGSLSRREALAATARETTARKDPEFEAAYSEYNAERASAGREPQSQVNFFPNPGTPGNLWGHELPMGTFAITFDDGPSKEWTPKILQALKDTNYRTSFFWLAKNLELPGMSAVVEAARNAGHTLGNHSFTHADLAKSDDVLAKAKTSLNHEIVDSTAVDRQVYGFRPSYFRCPYGSCAYRNVQRVRKMIADLRMLHVTWTIDSLDWQDKDPQSIYNRVVKEAEKNGRGIILFHDIHPQSYAASTQLLKKFFSPRRGDYRLLTISQIVRELNSLPPQEAPPVFKWLPWGKSE